MDLTNIMPRYGTREYQRLGIMLFALFAISVSMLTPDIAYAVFDGNFQPNSATVNNTNSSLVAWWKVISVWGMWAALLALAFSVLCMGGRLWYVPFALALIFMFGETLVNGLKNLMA